MLHHRCILNLYVGSTEIFQFLKKMSISQYFSKNHHNLHMRSDLVNVKKKVYTIYFLLTCIPLILRPFTSISSQTFFLIFWPTFCLVNCQAFNSNLKSSSLSKPSLTGKRLALKLLKKMSE